MGAGLGAVTGYSKNGFAGAFLGMLVGGTLGLIIGSIIEALVEEVSRVITENTYRKQNTKSVLEHRYRLLS